MKAATIVSILIGIVLIGSISSESEVSDSSTVYSSISTNTHTEIAFESTISSSTASSMSQSSSTTVEADPKTTTKRAAQPAHHEKAIVVANVCNMSLATFPLSDTQEEVETKCTCGTVDVSCRYLDITDLPSLISFPKNYHIANFEGNRISNLNSDTFYNGRDIINLVLSHNQIDFISSKAFLAFKKLQMLDLSHNRIWNLPSIAFEGLSDLRRLDLSYNDLFNILPELFAPLYELRELILESNPLHELQPKHFEHLSKLERLDLESTILQVIPDHLFVFTPRVKYLDLANNQLDEVPSEALHVLNRIKTLDLSGNPIKVVKSEAFRGMLGPVVLYMDRMPELQKIEKYAFGDATHMQELHCSFNFKLEDIDELAFVRKVDNDHVSLSQLFLRQNQLSSVPKALQDWNQELELHFKGNPLNCDCNLQWLVNLKLKNDFQADTRCETPHDLQKVALADLKDSSLHCGMQLSEIVMISCAAVLSIMILVMIVAFMTWRRNYRGYTKPYYVPRNNNIDDMDYRCDEEGM